MNIQVLISCMHQHDTSIIQRSNIQTDAIVINQCDKNSVENLVFFNKNGNEFHVKWVNTTERGLSKSRNMAIENAWADICVFCDDDEYFEDDYNSKIIQQFEKRPTCGVIAFKLKYDKKKFGNKEIKYNRFTVASVSSAQIAFNRKLVLEKAIFFDTMLGSGSGNGGGEETKFLFQLVKKGVEVIYVPVLIAEVKSTGRSLWFNGYTDQHIRNEGWGYRRIFGWYCAYPLLWFHALKHFKSSGKSFIYFLYLIHKGYFEKRK